MSLMTGLREKLNNFSTRIKSFASQKKTLLPYIGIGAAVVVILILVVALLSTASSGKKNRPAVTAVERFVIPPEELFLPREPDAVPGVLLEREKRETWTLEDAAPFWQDPLRNGEEPWREQLEAAIDRLMENVP